MQYLGIVLAVLMTTSNAHSGEFRVGVAKADITGPAGDLGMMGYGDPGQKTAGIHSRLHARALVFESSRPPEVPRRIAVVIADLAFISQAVKLEVVARLRRILGPVYSHDNLLLSATHTHSGPGGFSHYTLFNVTIGGFNEQNFEAIVSGMVRAITEADAALTPGSLRIEEGDLEGATLNRSLAAHQANPDLRGDDVNRRMTLIRATSDDGKDLGMLNWFAIHGTSLSKANRLISSDNKGYAASLFEKTRPGFVAAFGNSEEGDVSPNIFDSAWNRIRDDLDSVKFSGEQQARRAEELFASARESLQPSVDYRHSWIRMPGYGVSGEFTREGDQSLCKAALGYSFAAGAEDGPSGVPGFSEGMRAGEMNPITNPFLVIFGLVSLVALAPPDAGDDLCHFPKPVLAAPGRQNPVWTPEVIPFQLLRLGSLAILAVPAELTTHAGMQLRELALGKLGSIGIKHAVIAGLSNSYSDYVTTASEYRLQHYEGASTLYGPHTFDAYRQVFSRLAEAMRDGVEVEEGAAPLPIQPEQLISVGGSADDRRFWEKFGRPISEPESSYERGEIARSIFRSAHPAQDLRTEGAYVEIQHQNSLGVWERVATEDSPELLFEWRMPMIPDCLSCSDARVTWQIPGSASPGLYRMVHSGTRRNSEGELHGFSGTTRVFSVW